MGLAYWHGSLASQRFDAQQGCLCSGSGDLQA